METKSARSTHLGRNISKLRELRGMKQEGLAQAIGVTQQTISNIENSEFVDDTRLQEIANALGLEKEIIEKFNDDQLVSILSNSFSITSANTDTSSATNSSLNIYPVFNSYDKLVDLFEKNERLHEEKEKLYERLLASEKEKISLMEQLLAKK